MRSLPASDVQTIASELTVGDKVRITRSDASVVKFKLETISSEGIGGGDIFVAYTDIQQVELREHSTAKTVGLVAIILILIKGLADYANAYGDLLGSA